MDKTTDFDSLYFHRNEQHNTGDLRNLLIIPNAKKSNDNK